MMGSQANPKNYSAIPAVEIQDEEQDVAVKSALRGRPPFVVVIGVALLFAVLVFSTGTSPSPAAIVPPTLRLPAPRPCSFDECYASNCNHEAAPFTCLFMNGGPHGGCSPVPWRVPDTCTVSCDLSKCNSLAIPDSVKSCKGVTCDKEWCANPRVCPSDVQYSCTIGSAAFGCSSDDLQWTLRTDGATCSACCDTSTCK